MVIKNGDLFLSTKLLHPINQEASFLLRALLTDDRYSLHQSQPMTIFRHQIIKEIQPSIKNSKRSRDLSDNLSINAKLFITNDDLPFDFFRITVLPWVFADVNDCNVIRRAKQRFTNNSCNFKSSDGDIRDDLNLMNANVKIKISKQLRLILEHKYLSFFSFYVYTTCCLYRFVAIEILKERTPCFQRKCLNIEKTRRSWTAWKMADHKSAIADKSEKERWGESHASWYKSNKSFLSRTRSSLKKEETPMKHLLYNEGNLEGVKTEV